MKTQKLTSWLVTAGIVSLMPGFAHAAGNSNKGDVASAIQAMEDKWEADVAKKAAGVKEIEPMVADDFVGVSAKGKRLGKASYLAEVRKDSDTYTSTKNSNLKVYVMSSTVVIAVGDAIEKGKGKDGEAFDRTYRFTDTWLERNGKWQCVASQISLVRGRPAKG
jgi:ketosteroid isomerase-like protein